MHFKPVFLALFPVLLASAAVAQPVNRSAVSQFGITWTFDQGYPTGQFANGDYWVLGPVKIIGISPASAPVSGRTKHGSMLNPTPKTGTQQGYDSSMEPTTAYKAALNVALGVSSSKPLVINPSASLVSTISIDKAGNRPQVKTAAILTVVDKVPPSGSFRPAYCGDHKVRFNKSQLDYTKLKKLKPVMSVPSWGGMERTFERPWLDHVPGWIGRESHPQDNMPDYGRDMSVKVGEAALMLHLNISNTLKEKLLIRYVQLGIDLFGIVQAGGQNNWVPNGGHASGRKFPILFAGVMLGDAAMSNIGQDKKTHFGEDSQTFYVRETSKGVYNWGHGGYTAAHKGMPEWGIRHATEPQRDTVSWTAQAYRRCCTANSWSGFVLATHLMGLQQKWNHDALFDYQDRYIQEGRKRKDPEWMVSLSEFPIDMWDAYRNRKSTNAPTGLSAKVVLEDAFDTPTASVRKQLVKLQWDKFGESAQIRYNLYRQEGSKPLVLLRKSLIHQTYEDREVKKGMTYSYVVRAVSGQGESEPSKAARVSL